MLQHQLNSVSYAEGCLPTHNPTYIIQLDVYFPKILTFQQGKVRSYNRCYNVDWRQKHASGRLNGDSDDDPVNERAGGKRGDGVWRVFQFCVRVSLGLTESHSEALSGPGFHRRPARC